MNENLVGYLLNCLEPTEHQAVERELREHPELQTHLDMLKRSLVPLESDRDTIEPPSFLWVRTLARVAEHRCQKLTPAPTIPLRRSQVSPRNWWRRADVLVAASIFLCIMLLIPPVLSHLQYRSGIAACQNNMRVFHTALASYSDHHQGDFPSVVSLAPAPRNVAGLVVPALRENGLLQDKFSVQCPAQGFQPPSCPTLSALNGMDEEAFRECAPKLAGWYAYSLGYRQDGAYLGHRRFNPSEPGDFSVPILADRPPLNINSGDLGNSPNHAGRGQNVLFSDGHAAFFTNRNVGVDRDDIYLNQNDEVAAGKHRADAVLGESKARP